MELVPHGGLDGLLRKWQGPHNWRTIQQVGLDMAQAMLYLHSQQPAILHRDFKSANVLVSEWVPAQGICRVKVADLGLSCMNVCATVFFLLWY
jgi:serine/threonine protein kinase